MDKDNTVGYLREDVERQMAISRLNINLLVTGPIDV